MINKRIINNIKKTNEKVADLLSQIDSITQEQLNDILKQIEDVKEEKRLAKSKLEEELKVLKDNEKKIKESNSKVLKKKEDISKSIDVVSDVLIEGSKKLKTISDSTDKLVDKTNNAKKDALSVMNIFKRKEITNNYNFTFTKTSKITSKGVVFQNTIIKSIVIGTPQLSKSSQSNANYDAETVDVEVLKLKELQSISEKLNKVSISSSTPTEEKKEEKKGFDWKKILTGGGIGAAALGLGGKIASKAKPILSTAGKLGKFAKFIPLINAPFAIKGIMDRNEDSNKKLKGLDDTSKYAKSIKGAQWMGNVGDALSALPIPLIGTALGMVMAEMSDNAMLTAKEDYKKEMKDKWSVYDDPMTSLKLKVNGSSDMTVSNNYKKYNGANLDKVSGIKGKKEQGDIEGVKNLLKKNEQYTIDALTGKRKKIIAPKFEVDGKIDVNALKNGKYIKDLAPRLPENMNSETSLQPNSFTTIGGALGSQKQVTSGFMVSRDLFGKGSKLHKGIDISTPVGTMINAPEGGVLVNKVDSKGEDEGFGKYVELTTDSGYKVIFGHLSEYADGKVGSSKKVNRLDAIGYSGNSGGSTGAHIHLQVGKGSNDVYKTPINPSEWLQSLSNGEVQKSQLSSETKIPKLEEPKKSNDVEVHYLAGKQIGKTISEKQHKLVTPK